MSKEKTIRRKQNQKKLPTHQWTVDFLLDEFEKESDRAAVILVAALIDDALGIMLKSYLVPIPTSEDSLFDNATSPLGTFSAKIDIAHRIGLISNKLSRDIHLIRKIRNSFAHDIYGCDFNSGSVKSRINELYKSLEGLRKEEDSESRRKFLYCSGGILWYLNELIKGTNRLKTPQDESLYVVPTDQIEEKKQK